jgi:hypothetical protein
MKIILIVFQIAYLTMVGFLPPLQAESESGSCYRIAESSTLSTTPNWATFSNFAPSSSSSSIFGNSKITGTVTGPDGITPLEGILVHAVNLGANDSWPREGYTWTTADGKYSLDGLNESTYQVDFGSFVYIAEFYNNVEKVESSARISVGSNTIVSGINASLMEKGKITGLVTAKDGTSPLQDIVVNAWIKDNYGYWKKQLSTRTQSDGKYYLKGLDPGKYRVSFSNNPSERVSVIEQYFDNVTNVESAVDIEVATSTTVSGINALLGEKGKISGFVTGPGGVGPVKGIYACAYSVDIDGKWNFVTAAYTKADGSYVIKGLDKDTYKVVFTDTSQSIYADYYYNNAFNVETSPGIFVEENTTVTMINASLSERGKITGKVTGKDGEPLNDIEVAAFYFVPISGYGYWESDPSGSVRTRMDGTYSLNRLQARAYRIKFSNESSGYYAVEYYNNVSKIAAAEDIFANTNSTVIGIDASLVEKGKITGKVTGPDGIIPLKDIYVLLESKNVIGQWNNVSTAVTDSSGNYSFRGLMEDVYRIGFLDFNKSLYLTEWYDNVSDSKDSKNIIVKENTTVSDINASLTEKGRIEGIVTGPNGVIPLQGIHVHAYFLVGTSWSRWHETITQPNGYYTFTGLQKGSYRLEFADENNEFYDTEYYNNVFNFDLSQNIEVGTSASVSRIDVSLNRLRSEIQIEENGKSIKKSSAVFFISPKNKNAVITKQFTIKNIGNANLNRLKVSMQKNRLSNFTIGKLKASSLSPGSSATFKVTYKSSTSKTNSTLLFVSSDADDNSFVIRLTGKRQTSKAKRAPIAYNAVNFLTEFCSDGLADKTMVGTDLTGGLRYNTLTVFKSTLGQTAPGNVEVSTDLMDWFSGSDYTTVVTDNESYYKVRDNMPISKDLKRYIRLKNEAK